MLKWLPNHHIKFVKNSIQHDQIVIYKKATTHTAHYLFGVYLTKSEQTVFVQGILQRKEDQNCVPAAFGLILEIRVSFLLLHHLQFENYSCPSAVPLEEPLMFPLAALSWPQSFPLYHQGKAMRAHRKSLHDSVPPKCMIRPIDNKTPLSPSSPGDILLIWVFSEEMCHPNT